MRRKEGGRRVVEEILASGFAPAPTIPPRPSFPKSSKKASEVPPCRMRLGSARRRLGGSCGSTWKSRAFFPKKKANCWRSCKTTVHRTPPSCFAHYEGGIPRRGPVDGVRRGDGIICTSRSGRALFRRPHGKCERQRISHTRRWGPCRRSCWIRSIPKCSLDAGESVKGLRRLFFFLLLLLLLIRCRSGEAPLLCPSRRVRQQENTVEWHFRTFCSPCAPRWKWSRN